MWHQDDIPKINSKETMFKEIDKMDIIQCDIQDHDVALEKLCVDERCDK